MVREGEHVASIGVEPSVLLGQGNEYVGLSSLLVAGLLKLEEVLLIGGEGLELFLGILVGDTTCIFFVPISKEFCAVVVVGEVVADAHPVEVLQEVRVAHEEGSVLGVVEADWLGLVIVGVNFFDFVIDNG